MSKGYAEGSALEERFAELEQAKRRPRQHETPSRLAIFGSTAAEPGPHFLGWADEVDGDALFDSGDAYGITSRRVPAPTR